MADPSAKPKTDRHLSDLLIEGRAWPFLASLNLIHRLTLQVQTLHQQGRTHRAISAETISIDPEVRAQLGPPAEARRFGGDDADPEFCPPVLAQGDSVELPDSIDAAAAILREQGIRSIHERSTYIKLACFTADC